MIPTTFLFLAVVAVSAEYQWPSPLYDALEQFLYEGTKLDGISLGGTVSPCRTRTTDTNSSANAEWVRLAYHDVATYSNGVGGLDGSIAFELNNSANAGQGMIDTMSDFLPYPSKYVSRADVIAVGTLFAVAACGGPATIPFRGGRIDANAAGADGVPDLTQDLATHTAIFARQGFNQSEMIQLVACGHTLGGVRSADFPDVVSQGEVMFDNTLTFDSQITQLYLADTTTDPLIRASNTTYNSDLRIFSADNNVTVQSMATDDTFKASCATVLEKMINIVPSTVTLTDEITLLPAKVSAMQLTIDSSQLLFKVSFRYINTPSNSNRVVTLLWCDRYGSAKDCAGNVARYTTPASTTDNQSPVTAAQNLALRKYGFSVHLDPAQSISKFWFIVDEKNGTVTTYNNGGNGYIVEQDQVMFVPALSYMVGMNGTTTTARRRELEGRGGATQTTTYTTYFYGLTIAVRNTTTPSRAFANVLDIATTDFLPFNQTIDLTLNSSYPPLAGYNFYTGSVTVDGGKQTTVDSYLQVDNGTVYVDDFQGLYAISATAVITSPTATETGTTAQTTSIAAPGSSNGATKHMVMGASVIWAAFIVGMGLTL